MAECCVWWEQKPVIWSWVFMKTLLREILPDISGVADVYINSMMTTAYFIDRFLFVIIMYTTLHICRHIMICSLTWWWERKLGTQLIMLQCFPSDLECTHSQFLFSSYWTICELQSIFQHCLTNHMLHWTCPSWFLTLCSQMFLYISQ